MTKIFFLSQQSFTVFRGSQTISFSTSAPGGAFFQGPTYSPSASASPSGLAVTLSIDSSSSQVCVINNGVVSYIGVGSCQINANQGGTSNYFAASQVNE